MNHIRKATIADVSRIAEILVFTKRMNYRPIFQNDKVSFGEISFCVRKNTGAIRFYERHGFVLTKERHLEPGTTEFIVKMEKVKSIF